jgi:hypothetical protein
MKKSALLAALVLALGASTTAMAGEVYGQIGTEGLGLGYAQHINDKFNLRAEVNTYSSKNYTHEADGMAYDGKLTLGGASVLADYFPFANRFRVTTGLVVNNGSLTGSAAAGGGSYDFNGTSYAYTEGDKVTAKVDFGKVNPYLGIGFGHSPRAKGFGFYTDIGVMAQKATSSITVSGELAGRMDPADLEAERRALQESVDKFKAYPVIKMGVSYAF